MRYRNDPNEITVAGNPGINERNESDPSSSPSILRLVGDARCESLKMGDMQGVIAFWVCACSEASFSNLRMAE
jgi:hypothetical protein